MRIYTVLLLAMIALKCTDYEQKSAGKTSKSLKKPYIMVLGTAQDGGYPQANCQKACCTVSKVSKRGVEYVSSLAIIDPIAKKTWMIDATPDFREQLAYLQTRVGGNTLPDAVFLTHAHVGHYAGLINLGREIIGSVELSVYAMPKMAKFLAGNAPWSQLVELSNIKLIEMIEKDTITLSEAVKVVPLLVPHRDEFSETVGYKVFINDKTVLFIPDIDKWTKWELDVALEVQSVDYAMLDGTFYDGKELPNRDMSAIPHPFVVESMALFAELPAEDRAKVHFIHLNHTNPLLDTSSIEYKSVKSAGFNVARTGLILN